MTGAAVSCFNATVGGYDHRARSADPRGVGPGTRLGRELSDLKDMHRSRRVGLELRKTGLVTSARSGGSGCREQAGRQARALTLRDMKGGLGTQYRGRFGANRSAARLAIASSFSRSLVSSHRAPGRIVQSAHAEPVGKLLQAIACGCEHATEEPALAEFGEP
jgi:hypothetical protein